MHKKSVWRLTCALFAGLDRDDAPQDGLGQGRARVQPGLEADDPDGAVDAGGVWAVSAQQEGGGVVPGKDERLGLINRYNRSLDTQAKN